MFLELTDFFSFACNQSYVVCSKLLLIRIKIMFCWADCQVDRSVKYAIFMGVRNSANIYAVKIVSEVILCSSVVKTSYPVVTPLIQEVPPVGALLIQANINACGWLDLFFKCPPISFTVKVCLNSSSLPTALPMVSWQCCFWFMWPSSCIIWFLQFCLQTLRMQTFSAVKEVFSNSYELFPHCFKTFLKMGGGGG